MKLVLNIAALEAADGKAKAAKGSMSARPTHSTHLTAADIRGRGVKGFKPCTHSGPGSALVGTVKDECVRQTAAALMLAAERLAAAKSKEQA